MDLHDLSEATIAFVRENQVWAPVITGALAFCESLAFLSLLVPATVILVGIGALIGAGGLEFWPIWLGAALGASFGDWLSYEFGRHFKDRARRVWPMSRRPDLVLKAERLSHRFGAWGIFIGRFFGPARALVPLIAGMLSMSRLAFQAANISSALIWAFVLLAPGAGLFQYLFG